MPRRTAYLRFLLPMHSQYVEFDSDQRGFFLGGGVVNLDMMIVQYLEPVYDDCPIIILYPYSTSHTSYYL